MKRTKDNTLDTVIEQIRESTEPAEVPAKRKMLSSGSTLLNLACSDSPWGAIPMGKMFNLIGDSSSGKTFLALSSFAEAARKKSMSNYRFIFDDAEAANEFNIQNLFGAKVAEKVEPPHRDKEGEDLPSATIQDFHLNVHRALKRDDPFIYVLDSFDSITSEEEVDKVEANMKLREAGKEAKGSYGMDKAKMASQILRMIIRRLKKTDSVLIIISQTRDNTDPMSMQRKSRSGGRALKFYASFEMWLSIKARIRAKGRIIGVVCQAKVTKNKSTGKERTVEFPIFYDYGIDDIGSCIDFLVKESYWKKAGSKIKATEFGLVCMRDKLIRHVESNCLEKTLRKITGAAWKQIEDSLKLNRKRKYE